MKLSIINGPNLNLLGKREPNVYGNKSFDSFLDFLKKKYSKVDFDYFQSNIEGEIIDQIQKVGFSYDGILLNAAAFTHTSIGIADAIKSITTPVIEIHISNTFSREDFRHKSYFSDIATGCIFGLGAYGYELALKAAIKIIGTP